MGFPPWHSRIQIYSHPIVWWSYFLITLLWKVEELQNTLKKKCLIRSRIIRIKYTNPEGVLLHFTKLAVSRLIMVRFEKFEIWHAQRFDADLGSVTITTRATRPARWRHARAWRHWPSYWPSSHVPLRDAMHSRQPTSRSLGVSSSCQYCSVIGWKL